MNDDAVDHQAQVARTLWTLFEPVHSVTYFSPEARAAYEAAGLRGYWRGYFAGRAAALGAIGPAPVTAAFFGFAPPMVARAIPHVWDLVPPERVLEVRLEGAVAGLRRVLGAPADSLDEAAELAATAVNGLDHAGRVLGAAHAAIPEPADPYGRLWWAASILREHRGDGHVAALVAAGLGGCEVLRWRASVDIGREFLQPNRGWTDEEWNAAAERLVHRGWLTPDGKPTAEGIDEFRDIELRTDRAAMQPWQRLGAAGTARLRALLAPIALACFAELPTQTPMGLPKPMV
jgi:hypothetical protein